jgi:hypothetical protein
MFRKLIVFLGFAALLTQTVYAGGFTPEGKITEIYASGAFVIVKLGSVRFNPDGCPNDDGYFGLALDDPNYAAMFSLLVATQLSEKRTRFYVAGCSGQNDKHPKINSVRTSTN